MTKPTMARPAAGVDHIVPSVLHRAWKVHQRVVRPDTPSRICTGRHRDQELSEGFGEKHKLYGIRPSQLGLIQLWIVKKLIATSG